MNRIVFLGLLLFSLVFNSCLSKSEIEHDLGDGYYSEMGGATDVLAKIMASEIKGSSFYEALELSVIAKHEVSFSGLPETEDVVLDLEEVLNQLDAELQIDAPVFETLYALRSDYILHVPYHWKVNWKNELVFSGGKEVEGGIVGYQSVDGDVREIVVTEKWL